MKQNQNLLTEMRDAYSAKTVIKQSVFTFLLTHYKNKPKYEKLFTCYFKRGNVC